MISNIEYKNNSQKIISLTNSYKVNFWIGKNTSQGIITGFEDQRMYSGELHNLSVSGSVYAKIGIKKLDVDAFIPCPSIRRRTLLILKK